MSTWNWRARPSCLLRPRRSHHVDHVRREVPWETGAGELRAYVTCRVSDRRHRVCFRSWGPTCTDVRPPCRTLNDFGWARKIAAHVHHYRLATCFFFSSIHFTRLALDRIPSRAHIIPSDTTKLGTAKWAMSPVHPHRSIKEEEAEDKRSKPFRKGGPSCLECVRLKLKAGHISAPKKNVNVDWQCTRSWPCDNCVRRGCSSLCPDGTMRPR